MSLKHYLMASAILSAGAVAGGSGERSSCRSLS